MKLMTGCDEAVATWAANQLRISGFGPCAAFGVATNDGVHVGAIVFHNFQPAYRSVEVSIATTTPRWATRQIIRDAFSYAFERLGVQRISAFTPKRAKPARALLDGLGFKREGVARKGFGDDDAIISGLMVYEWRRGKWGPVAGSQASKAQPQITGGGHG